MRRRTIEYLLLGLLAIGLLGAGFAIAGGAGDGGKTKIATIRPTGIGLPRVGMHGTVGAGDIAAPLVQYHDSGHYESDLETVGGKAEAYLDRRDLPRPVIPWAESHGSPFPMPAGCETDLG